MADEEAQLFIAVSAAGACKNFKNKNSNKIDSPDDNNDDEEQQLFLNESNNNNNSNNNSNHNSNNNNNRSSSNSSITAINFDDKAIDVDKKEINRNHNDKTEDHVDELEFDVDDVDVDRKATECRCQETGSISTSKNCRLHAPDTATPTPLNLPLNSTNIDIVNEDHNDRDRDRVNDDVVLNNKYNNNNDIDDDDEMNAVELRLKSTLKPSATTGPLHNVYNDVDNFASVGCIDCAIGANSTHSRASTTSTCLASVHNSSVSALSITLPTIGGLAVNNPQQMTMIDPADPFEPIDPFDCEDGTTLRYSFKGFPPELYSERKEFIYRRPLVEKQLVLKKTCEWWFHKTKCSNMSTHWKKNAFLIATTCIFLLLGLIIFFCLSAGNNENSKIQNSNTGLSDLISSTEKNDINKISNKNFSSQGEIIVNFTEPYNERVDQQDQVDQQIHRVESEITTTPIQIDITDIQPQYVNHSFINDEDWGAEDDIENDIDDIDDSIPDDMTSDFVKPIKVHNFSLNDDDLLYESKRNHTSTLKDNFSAFSVTGTFRSKSSQIWDPHPEYILNTFGHQLHLILHQDTSFIPPKTFRVIRILNNRTEEEDEEEGHYLGCYYKGYVQDDDQSAVAVSLCNGMTGYIKTSFGSLLIQPVNQTSGSDDVSAEILHKVWRHSRRNPRHAVPGSSLELEMEMDLQVLEQNIFSKLKRQKRNYDDDHLFTMEVLVAVDHTMVEFHKTDLKSYILTLISIVSNIFSDASIGNSIYISVANILILKDDITAARMGRKRVTMASQLLKAFCSFLSKQSYHYDTAMLITRDEICRNERETKCDTLGLAELGTVCKRSSCSIVQDNGLPAAFTIAHELGHILNMPHDDDDRCRQFNKPGTKRKMHIMSSIMGDDIHPWSWSDCSRYYVSEFLEKEDKSCLEDTPTQYIKNFNTKQPGEIYSLDHQCQLIHGNQSRYCYLEDECKRLWCQTNNNNADCRSSNLPWADGTPCNSNRYWCQKGECVPREGNTRHIINGGWGPWSSFTPCSLTCGGGVQESQRECNNPLPKNGGKYCAGSRKKYRSCNTHSCPPGSLDSREQQCYDMNGRNLGIKGIDRSAKWIPKYGLSQKDKCKLYCRLEDNSAYFRLSEKVKDGTTCSFDSFDKCVNGICRPAGCDNELNSIAKLDKCGVCEGRNDTCEEFTENFYVSDLYKMQPKRKSYYYYVTTIPKGASNIVITQPGYSSENYIVLRDDQRNSLLNGNKLISTYRNVSFYAGLTFEYNGANSTIERVNTTYSRKLKRDLIVEIISLSTNAAKNNDSLLLSYSYTMDKFMYNMEPEVEIYRWEMQPWSSCDALCHGNSHRSPVCVSVTQALKVAPQFCESEAKPANEYQQCNTNCVLTLNISSISECSASCGMWGTREKTYNCIQTYNAFGRSNIVDLSYCMSKFEITRQEQCSEGCWQYTDWTGCSKSCGSGSQSRGVACLLNGTHVSDSLCDLRKMNLKDTIRICNTEPCRASVSEERSKINYRSVANNWSAGEWGECSNTCEKNRTVTCRSLHGHGCTLDKKPLTKRKCCAIKYVSNWSNCSVECGNGIRRKEIYCARVYKPEIKGTPRRRVQIDSSYCRHLRMPTPKRTTKPCKVSCKWASSDWTHCTADCSEEYQSRSVYCESVLGNPIAYKYCDATRKPPGKKICNNCVRRQSRIISACNCEGYRRRRIVCYDSTRKRIPCPTREKITKEQCQPSANECPTQRLVTRSIFPTTCAELRHLKGYNDDRDYTLYVRSRPKSIYCYKMSTTQPIEYISVSEVENYSIYYDYKTSDPNLCPPISRSHEYRDNSISSGRTHFRKLRINLSDLRVIENDYAFADTVGVEQPYGSAGDCYNRNEMCPQGDFSINLNGTGFYIRPGTIWDRFGNAVIMKASNAFETSRTARRAFCGGFCGRCSISSHSGLYLDV